MFGPYIYAIIWYLIHMIITIIELLGMLKIRVHALLLRSYDLCRSNAARERSERIVLGQCVQLLTKRPQHICVIIAPESKQIDVNVLQRLFRYALIADIPCISVYDTRNTNSGYIDLENVLPPKTVQREFNKHCIIWRLNGELTNGQIKTKLNGFTNSIPNQQLTTCLSNRHVAASEERSLELHQISASDGHNLIAQVCRDLFQQRHTSAMQKLLQQDRSKLTEHIDKLLHEELGIKEPEVGIIFSKRTCTYGLLPWHIRFTEFYKLYSESYFNAQAFSNILLKYSRCEQRWGK